MRRLFLTGILLMTALIMKAQSTDDFGIWANVEVEKKINKRWSADGELELRLSENASEIKRLSAKAGITYTIIKGVKAGVAYQFMHFHDLEYEDFQFRHRAIGYVQGRKKWGDFTLSLRERVQMTTKDDSDRIKSSGKIDTYKMNPEWSWRNRLKIAYDIPKCRLTPAASFETFYQLNNPDGNKFDGLRSIVSVTYKINKRHSIEFSGIYDKEINVNNPENRWVLGAGYAFSF